jgi:signal transduction histidine kinase
MPDPARRQSSIRQTTRMQFWLILCSLILLGLVSVWTLLKTRINGALYTEISVSRQLISDVLPPPLYIVEPYLTTTRLTIAGPLARAALIDKLKAEIAGYHKTLATWQPREIPRALHDELFLNSQPKALEFFAIAENELIPALAGQDAEAMGAIMSRLDVVFAAHRQSISRVAELAETHARQVEGHANRVLLYQFLIMAVVGGGILLAALLTTRNLNERIARRIDDAVTHANRMASGDLAAPINPGDLSANDEIGTVLRALEQMRASVAAHVQELCEQKEELAQQGDRLAAAKTRAEQNDRLKSEFIQNITHELRTPLNGIFGMLQLLSMSELPDEQRDMLDTAEKSTQTLFSLIDNMIFYSSLRAGSAKDIEQVFAVSDSIAKLDFRYKKQAEAKGLTFSCVLDPTLPPVLVGPAHYLDRALSALLDNAIKFTAAGKVSLEIEQDTAPAEAEDSIWLKIHVSDSGPGIPAQRMANLFALFVQADGSATRQHGGVGLGLALTKALTDAMAGEIHVENLADAGCRFTLRVPFRIETA